VSAKGEITPWLAESYKVADDLKSITLTLKKGVKFHDGTDFNAKAAKWNMDNVLATKSQPTWLSIDVIDDYTIKLNLSQWTNTVLTGLSGGTTYMVSPTAFEKNGKDWMRSNPVGTGPFKFVSFQRDVNYKTIKNPDYWNKGKPYLDAVELIYAADQMTQKALILSGSIDVLQVEPGMVASELQTAGLNMAMSVTSTFCMLPDTTHADSPFANQKVREALEYAIDREAIAKAFSYGYWQAPYQIPAPSSAAYNPNFTMARKFDLAKAKQLLSEAGYPNGFNATLLVIPVGMNKDIPLAIQANLSKINIKLEVSVPAIIPKFLQDSNTIHNALLLEPIFGGGNWNGALSFALRPGMTNMNGVWQRTPEFVDLYNATMTSRTPDTNLIRAVTDYLSKEAQIIPVFSGGSGYAMSAAVKDGGWFGRESDWKPEEIWLNM
jgi:peptide/nickel transport system substrate-binding protein